MLILSNRGPCLMPDGKTPAYLNNETFGSGLTTDRRGWLRILRDIRFETVDVWP